MSFDKVVCWNPELIHRVIDTEALQGEDHFFLATHYPVLMRRHVADGSGGALLSQEQFRHEFLDSRRVHTHAAILGTAGSGKSHLVRWLWATIPRTPERQIVLIPKVGTNLKRVIELVLG